VNRALVAVLGAGFLATLSVNVTAEKNNAPGVSDSEIKIGQTMPYSGPASALSVAGHAHAAYFSMINDQGGVNARKIRLISLDDAYSPARTMEQSAGWSSRKAWRSSSARSAPLPTWQFTSTSTPSRYLISSSRASAVVGMIRRISPGR